MLQRPVLVALLAITWIAGCGDDGGSGVPQGEGGSGGTSSGSGGTTSSGSGGATTSGSGGGTATGGGGAGGGAQACDYEGLVVAQERCLGGSATQATLYRARTAENPPYDVLSIQLWHDLGAPTGPFSFTFVGENYATCDVCGLMGQGCVDDLFENCEKLFLIVEGDLDITNNAATLTGSLSGARAVEVTIDWNNFNSAQVPNGEDWCLADHSFDTTVTAP